MNNQSSNQDELYRKMIVRAWKDPSFRKRLLSDPKSTLKELGIAFPKDAKIRCVENTEKEITIVLPQNPASLASSSEEELYKIAGGYCTCAHSCAGSSCAHQTGGCQKHTPSIR